ncbi:hypothetical protein [Bradyrhizobium sp. RDM4]|uniref:phage fiber-tail adaptor protein n=1 Tax=Bradyrhizobium sp. RDM4 TaxID=3378765 RepID=UPI0038FC46D2
MYVGRDFDPSDLGESETYTFDFVRDLASGETIVGATWFCTVAADSIGVDADAADHVAIPASYNGTKTMQHVSGLVAGVKYVLQAVVETDQGSTLSLWSHVLCGEPQ